MFDGCIHPTDESIAAAALEWEGKGYINQLFFMPSLFRRKMLLKLINSLVVEVVDLLFIEVNPRVIRHPHTTEFDYRSEASPL